MASDAFRLSVIKTSEDVDKLSHLTSDEKDLAKANLGKLPPTDGWWILGNDPELQAFWAITERELTAFLHPDFQGTPFSPMNLITLQVAKLLNCSYLLGVLSSATMTAIGHSNLGVAAYTKLTLLDYPDSSAWTPEERMTLEFSKACLERTMTNELFEQCVSAWGEQKTLRHLTWVTYVNQWVILEEALGMRYDAATMQLPAANLTPEMVKTVIDVMAKTRASVREMWDNLPGFAPPASD